MLIICFDLFFHDPETERFIRTTLNDNNKLIQSLYTSGMREFAKEPKYICFQVEQPPAIAQNKIAQMIKPGEQLAQ